MGKKTFLNSNVIIWHPATYTHICKSHFLWKNRKIHVNRTPIVTNLTQYNYLSGKQQTDIFGRDPTWLSARGAKIKRSINRSRVTWRFWSFPENNGFFAAIRWVFILCVQQWLHYIYRMPQPHKQVLNPFTCGSVAAATAVWTLTLNPIQPIYLWKKNAVASAPCERILRNVSINSVFTPKWN